MTQKSKTIGYIGLVWGIAGISLIFLSAITRMVPHALDALGSGLTLGEWIIMLAWCSFMLITEGYQGFQQQFSPRVATRALHLLNNPKPVDIILSPLFCMGYFHARRRRMITSWLATLGIILVIIIVHRIPQPWRGIIDSGVILGLAYGLISIYYFTLRPASPNLT